MLAATRSMLVEVGYARTTFDGIARRARVSRPAMYRRWPSKALLVHEAVFPEPTEEPSTVGPFAEELAGIVRGALAFFSTAPAMAAIPGLLMEMRSDPSLRTLFAARVEQAARHRFATEVVGRAAAEGDVRPGLDPDTVFDILTGAVLFATCVRDIDDLDAFATRLTDLLLHGMRPPG